MADLLPFPAPPLANGLVALRAWTEQDLPFIVEACQDPAISRYSPVMPSPYGESDARAWLASQEPARRAGHRLALAIVDASSCRALGAVALSDVVLSQRRSAVGYWLAKPARGRGAASEAVRLLSAWAFDALGIGRLELFAHPENVSSRRLAKRCGFTREGLLRSHMLMRNSGERRDSCVYGLLPGELLRK